MLENDLDVRCWGNNQHGGLGLGDTANRGVAAGQMGDDLPVVDLGTGHSKVLYLGLGLALPGRRIDGSIHLPPDPGCVEGHVP